MIWTGPQRSSEGDEDRLKAWTSTSSGFLDLPLMINRAIRAAGMIVLKRQDQPSLISNKPENNTDVLSTTKMHNLDDLLQVSDNSRAILKYNNLMKKAKTLFCKGVKVSNCNRLLNVMGEAKSAVLWEALSFTANEEIHASRRLPSSDPGTNTTVTTHDNRNSEKATYYYW